MDIIAWSCNKCKLNYSLPAIPMPMCYVCNVPLVRARATPSPPPLPPKESSAPPVPPRNRNNAPPVPPRNRGGPPPVPSRNRGGAPPVPPSKNLGRGRLDAATIAGTPMGHYFNLYLPSVLQGAGITPGSKHAAYRVKLRRHKGFVAMAQAAGEYDIKDYIERYEEYYNILKTPLARKNVVLKHIYNQLLDYRLYMHDFTVGGWCLGISGFWLKHKREGVNVFPNEIYNTPELAVANGPPIKLMSNQQKLVKHYDLVQIGGKDEIPVQAKNVLDYIAGGRHVGGEPSIRLSMHTNPSQTPIEARRFHRMLAPRGATPEQKAADRFAVLHFVKGGGAHMMALDMEAVEFFDPNFGIFTVANQSRQKLIDFVFQDFYPICYPGEAISDFFLIRIE